MSLFPRLMTRTAVVAVSALPLLMAAATPAVATDIPPLPECVEVYVFPDDATLPWLLVCRPGR